MKTCPNCKITVGGGDTCPLCQSELVGPDSPPIFPTVEPEQRRLSMLYKILAFCLLSATVLCGALDFMGGRGSARGHWSLIVLFCVVSLLVMLRILVRPHPNLPRLMFQLLVGVSLVVLLCDWYVGFPGFSVDYVVPILCSVTLLLNFILAFIHRCYTENGLVYLLMNIFIGVVPYLVLLLRHGDRSTTWWAVCLVISVITFLGLAVFRGRSLWVELQKRLHL